MLPLRKLFDLFQVLRNHALNVFGLKLFESRIGLERGVQFTQDARIVDNVAVLFIILDPVHACNRLQKAMRLERLVEVENRVLRRIEPGQELIDDNQDLRVFAILKGSND